MVLPGVPDIAAAEQLFKASLADRGPACRSMGSPRATPSWRCASTGR